MPKFRVKGGEGAFAADFETRTPGAGELTNPAHDAAIDRAMRPLYGGLTGARCDPVEEFPGDADKPYGIPSSVKPLGAPFERLDGDGLRDDGKPVDIKKPGKLKDRDVAASDLSGDRVSDDRFQTHH